MKKLIIAIMLLATIKANSQTIDVSIKSCKAAKIETLVINNGFPVLTDTVTHLGVFNYTDDLSGNCSVNWVLLNKSKNVITGVYFIKKEEYAEWNSSSEGLLKIIAENLKLKFK